MTDNNPKLIDSILGQVKDSKAIQESIGEKALERLEKEFFGLCEFLRHYSISRWTTMSFFIMLSFGITSYLLPRALDNTDDLSRLGLLLSIIIYWFSFFLYKIHKRFTIAANNYLRASSEILGFYSPAYIRDFTISKITSDFIFLLLGFIYTVPLLIFALWPSIVLPFQLFQR